jgi:DNA-binding transcriptional regulator YhcF (GntR family)
MKKTKEQNTNLIDESLTNDNESKNNNELIINYPTKHNFIIVYDSIYKNTELSALELQILIKLISIAPTFKPSLRKLATLLKQSKPTILNATNNLQKMGYLEITKHGNKSTWVINQVPKYDEFKTITFESLYKKLDEGIITVKDLKKAHKLKIIDDTLFIKIMKEYEKEIQRLIHIDWLEQ